MIRGTTPTNTIETDIDLTGATIFVTYSQGGSTVFEKTGDDLTVETTTGDDGNQVHTITTVLSQEDTLALKSDLKVRVQIRAVFENGCSVASEIMEMTVGEILKDGVIEYEP